MESTYENLFNSNFPNLKFNIIKCKSDFNEDINEIKNESKIFVIDKRQFKDKGIISFECIVICGDNLILIVNIQYLYLFQIFFSKNKDSTIYFLHNSKEHFNKLINNECKEFKDDKDIFSSEIYGFLQNHIKTKNQFEYFNIIKHCLYGYIIRKSYVQARKNKIDTYNYEIYNEYKIFSEKDVIQLRLIGKGYSSYVSLVYNIKNNKLYALKSLNDQNDVFCNLQQREINNYLKISHPFISQFYGVIENDQSKTKSILIEFIDGKSLANIHLLKLNENEKIKIIFQIMIVLEYFHNNGFVYRDLKPSNIIINYEKSTVIVDFDRMISLDEKKTSDQFTNDFSSCFAAKELNDGFVSYKSDIYSLGLLIYYIIMEQNSKYLNEKYQFDFPSKFSKLIKICNRCTLDDPDERPCISELIDFFYENFFSIIQVKDLFQKNENDKIENLMDLSEINTIKTIKNIHDKSFIYYWALLSEYKYSISHALLIKYYSPLSTNNFFPVDEKKTIHYLNLLVEKYFQGVLTEINDEKSNNKILSYIREKIYSLFFDFDEETQQVLQFNNNENNLMPYDSMKEDLFNYASKHPFPWAYNILGLLYLDKHFRKFNVIKSFYYFNLALKMNSKEAQYNVANLYFEGIYVKKDINKAIYLYQLSADQDFALSAFNLGFIYINYKNDYKKAFYYIEKAAKLDFLPAISIIGAIYIEGNFVTRDINKGIYYLKSAAKKKEPIALINLGIIFFYGRYIEKDLNKALSYFLQAAENNISIAQHFLGIIYLNPYFKSFSIDKGINYLTLAADQKYHYSNFYLGRIYLKGKIVKRNINKALYYLKIASNLNNKMAQAKLGSLYLKGKVVPRDIKKAIQYLTMASNESNFNEMLHPYNIENIEKYFGENNIIFHCCSYSLLGENIQFKPSQKAILKLGILYHDGKYIKRDIEKAIYFYKNLSSFNNQFAKNNLGVIYKIGDNVEKNLGLAIEYFNEAIQQKNDKVAKYNLATIYLFELKNEENYKKSIDLLIKSYYQGFNISGCLICLALMLKNRFLNYETICTELIQYQTKSFHLNDFVFLIYNEYELEDETVFQTFYEIFFNISYVYGINEIIPSGLYEITKQRNDHRKNINEQFYEGFGKDLDEK